MTSASEKGGWVLASASPRRRDLLHQVGINNFSIIPAGIDETVIVGEAATDYAARIAAAKALRVSQVCVSKGHDKSVLAADTIVVSAANRSDEEILGKPSNIRDAERMLRVLSGTKHQVITAVAVARNNAITNSLLAATDVTFFDLSDAQIASYLREDEYQDKAGAYAIQGMAAGFVDSISGSYSNVVGLPLAQTIALLVEAGVIDVWPGPS